MKGVVEATPRRRVYFAIAYDVDAFVTAAAAYAASIEARPGFDRARDELVVHAVASEADLRAVWQLLLALGGDGDHVIQEGQIFAHATLAAEGALSADHIARLPRLAWAADGVLLLSSCGAGVEDARGWSPAQLFARRQRVATLGELAGPHDG